ncbi:MAG TPA: hypothetical protein VE868_11010, partial [Balneolaceae bacterium]|nr:hypothetical protein [Balneolaceae bacterium]
DDSFKNITIEELVAFFQHPSKYLLQQRLGVYLQDDSVLDQDQESFKLDKLEEYQMGQQLLERFLEKQSLESYQQIAEAKNLLPDGWPGQKVMNNQVNEVQRFGSFIKSNFDQEELETQPIDFSINGFHLGGRLNDIYEKEQLFYRFGRKRPKDLVALWIRHVCFQMIKPDDHPGYSRLITLENNNDIRFSVLSPVMEAEEILENLLNLYWSGMKKNLIFFPETSYTFAREIIWKGKSEDEAVKYAKKKWLSNYRPYYCEGNDPYNKYLIKDGNPLENKELYDILKNLSIRFWKPFFEVFSDEKGGAL